MALDANKGRIFNPTLCLPAGPKGRFYIEDLDAALKGRSSTAVHASAWGVIPMRRVCTSGARDLAWSASTFHARSLGPLVKARAFGMTPNVLKPKVPRLRINSAVAELMLRSG